MGRKPVLVLSTSQRIQRVRSGSFDRISKAEVHTLNTIRPLEIFAPKRPRAAFIVGVKIKETGAVDESCGFCAAGSYVRFLSSA